MFKLQWVILWPLKGKTTSWTLCSRIICRYSSGLVLQQTNVRPVFFFELRFGLQQLLHREIINLHRKAAGACKVGTRSVSQWVASTFECVISGLHIYLFIYSKNNIIFILSAICEIWGNPADTAESKPDWWAHPKYSKSKTAHVARELTPLTSNRMTPSLSANTKKKTRHTSDQRTSSGKLIGTTWVPLTEVGT